MARQPVHRFGLPARSAVGVLLALVSAWPASAAPAADAPPAAPPAAVAGADRTFLWKVTSDRNTVYVLGSVHFVDGFPVDEDPAAVSGIDGRDPEA